MSKGSQAQAVRWELYKRWPLNASEQREKQKHKTDMHTIKHLWMNTETRIEYESWMGTRTRIYSETKKVVNVRKSK